MDIESILESIEHEYEARELILELAQKFSLPVFMPDDIIIYELIDELLPEFPINITDSSPNFHAMITSLITEYSELWQNPQNASETPFRELLKEEVRKHLISQQQASDRAAARWNKGSKW